MQIIQKILSLLKTLLGLHKQKLEIVQEDVVDKPVKEYEPEPEDLLTNTEKIYRVAAVTLGKDISTLIDNEVACAEVMSGIINQAIPDFSAGVLSTADLNIKLKNSPYFRQELEPSEGAIIVSPRTATIYGHTGCFLSAGAIASNNSKTGKFEVNYNFDTWATTFGAKGRGLKIYIYKAI